MGASLAYDRVAHADPLLVTLRGARGRSRRARSPPSSPPSGSGRRSRRVGRRDLDVTAERLARAADAKDALAAAVALEEELVALYRNALPALPDAKIAMTAATILGSHSQHLLILQRETAAGKLETYRRRGTSMPFQQHRADGAHRSCSSSRCS